jgi:hypothetical protein
MELALLRLIIDGHVWVSSPDDTRDTTIANWLSFINSRVSASFRRTYTSRDKPVVVLWWTRAFRREDTNGKGRPRSRTFITKTHVQES